MASLSLQMHRCRAGHWIVATGTARNTCDEQAELFGDNPFTYIIPTEGRRLANPPSTPLEIVEVEIGGCSREDSVVRIESHRGNSES